MGLESFQEMARNWNMLYECVCVCVCQCVCVFYLSGWISLVFMSLVLSCQVLTVLIRSIFFVFFSIWHWKCLVCMLVTKLRCFIGVAHVLLHWGGTRTIHSTDMPPQLWHAVVSRLPWPSVGAETLPKRAARTCLTKNVLVGEKKDGGGWRDREKLIFCSCLLP